MDNEKKNTEKLVIVFTVADILLFIIFIIGITYILQYFNASNDNKQMYQEIANNTEIQVLNTEEDLEDETSPISENVQKVVNLKQENQDVIGWIQIDNTDINYPILQSSDDEYYLKHNYKKEKSKYGSIFIKSSCNILDTKSNVIIYGHNMNDTQMFNQLLNYENKDYYTEHPIIRLATEQGESQYEIVSVFKSRVFYQDETNVFRYYNYTTFDDEKTYSAYIENCKKIQLYDTGVSAEYGEQLITLSTCEYSQSNGRFVVVAKKLNSVTKDD